MSVTDTRHLIYHGTLLYYWETPTIYLIITYYHVWRVE